MRGCISEQVLLVTRSVLFLIFFYFTKIPERSTVTEHVLCIVNTFTRFIRPESSLFIVTVPFNKSIPTIRAISFDGERHTQQ